MLEPRRGSDGLWRLEFMHGRSGTYARDEDNEAYTFTTRKAADAARYRIERGYSNIDRVSSDRHRKR